MSGKGRRPGGLPGEGGPVESAIDHLARTVHDELVRDVLGADPDLDPGAYQRLYPPILFGELAMHLAGITLPPSATPADRARAVVQALRTIGETPDLLESITRAPFTGEVAASYKALQPSRAARRRPTKEQAAINELRRKIAAQGFLDHATVPPGQSIRLEYTGSAALRGAGLRRRGGGGPDHTLTLMLMAYTDNRLSWTVEQYDEWDILDGFVRRTGTRKVPLSEVFKVLWANSSHALPRKVERLVDQVVRIGRVAAGVPLRLTYDFRHDQREVSGYESTITSKTLALPMVLRQAYAGNDQTAPLFGTE